jgi:hypothetical protein
MPESIEPSNPNGVEETDSLGKVHAMYR